MNGEEKSDRPIVPEKHPNKPGDSGAEGVEERGLAEGKPSKPNTPRTQIRKGGVPNALERLRLAAERDRQMTFTGLLHHIKDDRLRAAYHRLNRKAAPGVDDLEWADYHAGLEENLLDLEDRIQRGAYRAKPSRRAYIPKPDGGQRPLGIASLEDKIVQSSVAEVLGAIYEVEFLGFSYGFRPKRNAHMALDALAYGIKKGKVNWILDADISGYFDAIPHDRLMEFVEKRIGDPRVLRLLKKWLNAGVLENGELKKMKKGSPQGASISPLLANIYLHYVFDLWAHEWRKTHAHGEVYIVRYADDFVLGFQRRADAEQFLDALRGRFAEYGLELHPKKTQLIEFGRFARKDRKDRDDDPPDTFDFLGFTHSCGVSRNGKFLLQRRTITSRFRRKLQSIKVRLRAKMHLKKRQQGQWLGAVFRGYSNYYAVPTNMRRIRAFRREIARIWLQVLRRRSQKDRTTWKTMQRMLERWVPTAVCVHDWPDRRMEARLAKR